jgi:ATP-dependent DNA helicase RecG
MTTLDALHSLIAHGESETLELKTSTAELRRAGETLCASLNGEGGQVVIGVAPDGKIKGQQVTDSTLRDVAAMLGRFEPAARVEMGRIDIGNGRSVIVLDAPSAREHAPFIFEGKPYRRVGSTTTVMGQDEYGRLLLDRNHSRHRWENQPAVRVSLEDLDHEEILRTRDAAIQQRRISAGTSTDVGDILDRLGLRRGGVITQAAQILYGTRFLPDYPQGMLKMGRFRGTKITGDILDNRQEHLHAFAIVREAMAWLDRTLPLAAHFPPGQIFREDRLPVPPEALREVLLNAVMHRDYTQPGSYVAIAVFDDRIEIRSIGGLPRGVTAESLSGLHRSVLRNPLIAEAFHRTGAVEIWGRGTNRVIEECERYGIAPPTFEEIGGALFVTFRAQIGPTPQVAPHVTPQVEPQVAPQAVAVLRAAVSPRTRAELQDAAGLKDRKHFRTAYLDPLVEAGLLSMTIPDKPRSSQQRYQTTEAGARLIEEGGD